MFILCLHLFTCNKQVSGNDCAVLKNQYFLLITVSVSWDQFVIISRWNSIKNEIYLIWPNSHDNWWQSKKHCTNAICSSNFRPQYLIRKIYFSPYQLQFFLKKNQIQMGWIIAYYKISEQTTQILLTLLNLPKKDIHLLWN